jgi:hypothetical protein
MTNQLDVAKLNAITDAKREITNETTQAKLFALTDVKKKIDDAAIQAGSGVIKSVVETGTSIINQDLKNKVETAMNSVLTKIANLNSNQVNALTAAVPVGTIIPYGGTNRVVDGWLPCDGTLRDRNSFSNLFGVISTNWGSGDNSNTFNLPNLQGMFLRGVDSSGVNDPDFQSRSDSKGQPIGPMVGSIQTDSFQGHWHKLLKVSDAGGDQFRLRGEAGGASGEEDGTFFDFEVNAPTTDHIHGDPRISSETRPKNAYVYYIIKY